MIEELQTITISAMEKDEIREIYQPLVQGNENQKVLHTFGLLMNISMRHRNVLCRIFSRLR